MKIIVAVCLALVAMGASAQGKYFTKSGVISFNAGTAVEDIDAVNKSATSVFDVATGQVEFAVLIKGFEFKRDLMQEHFNENYLESTKFPKAVFKGVIKDVQLVALQKDGTYPVKVAGTMEIHGVKKEVEAEGVFKVVKGIVSSTSDFTLNLADYQIAIPGAVKDKINPVVKVHTDRTYKPL